MMKKIAVIALTFICLIFASACNCGGGGVSGTSESSMNTVQYTVTFVQEGYENITRQVGEGQTLTDVPTPQAKKGYEITWDTTDFTNIISDLTVNAVETAKKYKITFEVNNSQSNKSVDEMTVSFNEKYTLPTLTDTQDYVFVSWKVKESETVYDAGVEYVYNTDANLVVEAVWDAYTGEH